MIFSSVEDVAENDLSTVRYQKALEFLRTVDLAALPLGRNEIMGDEVFANVMSFETSHPASKDYEAHRAYVDIHYVIEGTEVIGVAPVEECEPTQDFNEADDFCLYKPAGREAWVTLHAGDMLVTPPADAHKPGCCAAPGGEGTPAPLKKMVVKVLVN